MVQNIVDSITTSFQKATKGCKSGGGVTPHQHLALPRACVPCLEMLANLVPRYQLIMHPS